MKKVLIICCFFPGIVFFMSCLKEADLPVLTTTEVSNIKTRTAVSGGTITDDGGAEIIVNGICWGDADNPTFANSMIASRESGIGNFECILSGLTPGFYYHVRAFAKNRAGTAYGNCVHFRALQTELKVTTTSANALFYTAARAEGSIECNDESSLLERGFSLAPAENPAGESWMWDYGSRPGIYSGFFEGLQPGTLYNVRAYARTPQGIVFGGEICFKTPQAPSVTTTVKDFTRTSAKVEGNITWNEDPPGNTAERGIYFGATINPVENKVYWNQWTPPDACQCSNGEFACTLADLTPGTLYYVRAYIRVLKRIYDDNYEFTQSGNEVTFTTSQ